MNPYRTPIADALLFQEACDALCKPHQWSISWWCWARLAYCAEGDEMALC